MLKVIEISNYFYMSSHYNSCKKKMSCLFDRKHRTLYVNQVKLSWRIISGYYKYIKPVMAGRYVAAMFHLSDAKTGGWNGDRHEEILREERRREAQMWLSPRRKESLLGKLLQWICRKRGPYAGVSLISWKKKKKQRTSGYVPLSSLKTTHPRWASLLTN